MKYNHPSVLKNIFTILHYCEVFIPTHLSFPRKRESRGASVKHVFNQWARLDPGSSPGWHLSSTWSGKRKTISPVIFHTSF